MIKLLSMTVGVVAACGDKLLNIKFCRVISTQNFVLFLFEK